MALIDLIQPEVIKVGLAATTMTDAIRELVELLHSAGKIENVDEAYDAVLAREAQCSTGLEKGLAVPHGKTEAVPGLTLAIGTAPQGIDTNAIDGQPSKVFFMMLARPGQAGPHIEALAEVARIASSPMFIRELAEAANAEDVVELFKEE
ncbi:MAG: PTS sugar transporter subunit IIA [Planctomycetota bacterium]|jgi:mannitol/fructose-specific phosphotransferase system IIA component (Ntr-type)